MARCSSDTTPSATNEQATIVLNISPSKIRPGGTAQIVAIGTKTASGQPIWDSVVIGFKVDAGRIVPESTTFADGKASATYYAPSRTGTATLGAVSGTVEIADVAIEIGWGELTSLVLSASRTELPPQGGHLSLRALAANENGDPIPSLPVVFSTTGGTLGTKGRPVKTNAAGVAKDTLDTTADATVSATSGALASNTVTIDVEDTPENVPPVADFVFSPESPLVGETVYFNGELSSDEDGTITKWRWDFGDGRSGTGRRATHVYDTAATWTVVLCVTDDRGATDCTNQSVTIADEESRGHW